MKVPEQDFLLPEFPQLEYNAKIKYKLQDVIASKLKSPSSSPISNS